MSALLVKLYSERRYLFQVGTFHHQACATLLEVQTLRRRWGLAEACRSHSLHNP